LTSRTEPAGIIAQQKSCRVNTIQICDRLVPGAHRILRESLPGVSLVQVVHVSGESSVDEASEISRGVDAILLDSGNQSLPIKELGGTGRTHDWSLSKRIVQSVDVPVFLAGGLRKENVCDAIRTVGPFGVDLCTGVRTDGRLDRRKLSAFMRAVKSAARQIAAGDV
jgi:phosphoribosylanthranilate isomerase